MNRHSAVFFASCLATASVFAADLNPSEQRVSAWTKEIRARSPRCDRKFQARLAQVDAKTEGNERGFKQEAEMLKILNLLAGAPKLPPSTALQFVDFVAAKSGELKASSLVLDLLSIHCPGTKQWIVLERMMRDEFHVLRGKAGTVRQLAARVRQEVTEPSGHFDYLVLISQIRLMQKAIESGLFKVSSSGVQALKELRTKSQAEYARLNGEFGRYFKGKTMGDGDLKISEKDAAQLLRAQLSLILAARSARREFERILASLG